ncbi:hypothetical protein JMN32_20715 [Fulvivirga sp. 29W222]|uniref:Uncharacterized protein n=1 Tax=Fulvivirga marina TaxID=2494733 RepID=A0A937G158_9BACT|nr:hypothetical protein [Fulvivirga marina]MBL6448747.1 hypothetical protein [Fulvivirga marina]
MKDRTVIIADDGMATEATLSATIAMCKKQHASKIVVTTPILEEKMVKNCARS